MAQGCPEAWKERERREHLPKTVTILIPRKGNIPRSITFMKSQQNNTTIVLSSLLKDLAPNLSKKYNYVFAETKVPLSELRPATIKGL